MCYVHDIAHKRNATNTQVALAWLMPRKRFIVPLPGARNSGHLNENLGAVALALAPADLAELEASLAGLTVRGGRMNAEQMQVVDTTT